MCHLQEKEVVLNNSQNLGTDILIKKENILEGLEHYSSDISPVIKEEFTIDESSVNTKQDGILKPVTASSDVNAVFKEESDRHFVYVKEEIVEQEQLTDEVFCTK